MNIPDLVAAAGSTGGEVGRAVTALVRVAVAARALNYDCQACDVGRRGEPCDCPTEALEAAVNALESVVGPIPLQAEPAP